MNYIEELPDRDLAKLQEMIDQSRAARKQLVGHYQEEHRRDRRR